MGLLDFVKDIGKKVFTTEDEASALVKDILESDNPGVKDLGISVQDGVVTMSGVADSAEALEKAVLMAGNIQGIGEVNFENMTAPAATEKVEY